MEAAATQKQIEFPWKDDKPLSQTLNMLENHGRYLTNEFIRKNPSIFLENNTYIPFEDLHDFLGYDSLSSNDGLSLVAYSLFRTEGSQENTNPVEKTDYDICMRLGSDLNQFRSDMSKGTLYINTNPFFVDAVSVEDKEVYACIQLFNELKKKRP